MSPIVTGAAIVPVPASAPSFTVTRVVASDLRITGAQCDGVTVSGPSVVLTNSLVEGNGFRRPGIGVGDRTGFPRLGRVPMPKGQVVEIRTEA